MRGYGRSPQRSAGFWPELSPDQAAEARRLAAEKDETIDALVNRARAEVRALDRTVLNMQRKLQQNGG